MYNILVKDESYALRWYRHGRAVIMTATAAWLRTPSQLPISIETQFNHTRGAEGKCGIGRGDNPWGTGR